MGTWIKEELPLGRKVVGCRWVYVRKRDEHGAIIKHKAQLVTQGFSQKPGIDYSDNGTFTPVMQFETLRTMLAHLAINNWKLRQLISKEHIYMENSKKRFTWHRHQAMMMEPDRYTCSREHSMD